MNIFSGPKRRAIVGSLYQLPFGIAFVLMAILTKLIHDWRQYLFIISASSTIIVVAMVLFVKESPRWLFTKNRLDEAMKIMLRAAKINGVDNTSLKSSLDKHVRFNPISCFGIIKDVYTDRLLIKYIFFMAALAASGNICFFTATVKIKTGKWKVHWSLITSCFFLILGCIIGSAFMFSFGRKTCLFVANICAGVICLFLAFTENYSPWLHITGDWLTLLFMSMHYSAIFLYATELFPTPMRAFSLGNVYLFSNFVELSKPFITRYINVDNVNILLIISGAILILACILLFYLPETTNRTLHDTIVEVHDLLWIIKMEKLMKTDATKSQLSTVNLLKKRDGLRKLQQTVEEKPKTKRANKTDEEAVESSIEDYSTSKDQSSSNESTIAIDKSGKDKEKRDQTTLKKKYLKKSKRKKSVGKTSTRLSKKKGGK